MNNKSFKEVINLLEKTEKRPYNTFERIVLTLLEKYVTDEGKEIRTYYRNLKIQADAYLPEGIDNNNNPTFVDVKYINSRGLGYLRDVILKTLDGFKRLPQEKISVLVIINHELKDNEKENLTEVINKSANHVTFLLWDLNKLSTLFDRYAEFVSSYIPNIEKKAIENIVNKSLKVKDWKVERDSLLLRLKETYENDDLTLLLGAGVSSSAGLPSWNSLLSQLLISLISPNFPKSIDVSEEDKAILANSLQELNNSSPLIEARYINAGLRDNFEKEVADILYKNIKTQSTSPLINSIGNLCIPPRGLLGIKAIITYNFDDLIERKLDNLNLRYKSIFKDADIPTKQELGVFHVHGFLPEISTAYDGISESLLVFSEKNYHTLMQDPYFWSNLIQLNFFRESTCLLIGLSGTDPNLRRLLEIAKVKNKIAKHYILLKRTKEEIFVKNFQKNNQPVNNSLIETINSIHHQFQERSFDELGVNVIWYEDYDELPKLIEQINSNRKSEKTNK